MHGTSPDPLHVRHIAWPSPSQLPHFSLPIFPEPWQKTHSASPPLHFSQSRIPVPLQSEHTDDSRHPEIGAKPETDTSRTHRAKAADFILDLLPRNSATTGPPPAPVFGTLLA